MAPSCLSFAPSFGDSSAARAQLEAKKKINQDMAAFIASVCIAELEKLGQKYRLALRTAKDPRFERLPAVTKGNYADDDIVERVTQHRCYIVATCDRELRRRMRKIVGVPIMYIKSHRFSIERLPEATLGNAPAM